MWKFLALVLLNVFTYSYSQNADDCRCVFYYLCDQEGYIIQDGSTLIDDRSKFSTVPRCSCTCTLKDHFCCRLRNNETTIPTTPPSSKLKKCGFSNPDGVGFKIAASGENVLFGEFPWMVGILDDNGAYRCGGSLIHPSVILTAAHCVTNKNTYIARAGEYDSSATNEVLKHQDRTVSSVEIHEDYTPGIYHNDIALLFLNSSFNLRSHINLMCLPPSDVSVENQRCYVTGWGKDLFGSTGQYPAILKKIDLPLVDKNTCQTNLKQTNKLGKYFNLHRSFICAGGEKNKDVCVGDGGGPLFCPINENEERYQQIGIVSWGIGCNQENLPGVYSNVPFFRDWIDKQVKAKNFDTTQYQY